MPTRQAMHFMNMCEALHICRKIVRDSVAFDITITRPTAAAVASAMVSVSNSEKAGLLDALAENFFCSR
jgi:hypothetical protein